MVKSLKVDPHTSTTSTSMVSANDKKSQPQSESYYETLETYQGLPCPYGGYYGFYYPGLDGSFGEAKDYGFYSYGTDVQYPVMQGENGSLIYMIPGVQSYDVTHTYMPLSIDSQYSNPAIQSSSPPQMYATQGYYQNPYGYGDVSSQNYLWDDKYVYGVAANSPNLRQNISSSSHNQTNYSKTKTSFSSTNGFGDHRPKTPKKVSGLQQGKGSLNNQERVYPMESTKKKSGTLNWDETEKAKLRNKENGECEPCSLKIDDNNGGSVIRRDQYNLSSFETKYEEAVFFVIKSYSEDDIHKSIKYNVWSSTPNGNKKLNNAYQDSQKKITEKSGKCPVFLFFSVNASGQFCGVAEMIGGVDYEKSMEFWQQDKWTGYFPVKWHIIKDVPNPQLRHIILENNENKPVTNSRDTQEVRLPQGIEVLNIFKNFAAKTSILDDFEFYENREKVMIQKKLRFNPVTNPVQIKTKEEDLVAELKTMEISDTVKAVEKE